MFASPYLAYLDQSGPSTSTPSYLIFWLYWVLRQVQNLNTPGTAGGPGGLDRTLAVKNKIYTQKIFFCIYLLVMPKYWGKQIFAHGSFPEVGQKQKTERRKKRGPNDGNNNGQAPHGARKHAWRTQAAWVNFNIYQFIHIIDHLTGHGCGLEGSFPSFPLLQQPLTILQRYCYSICLEAP